MVDFVIVPVVPTEEMVKAGLDQHEHNNPDFAALVIKDWLRMIHARPEIPHGDITPAMARVLCVIARWLHEKGQVPTYKEIMRDLGLQSTGNVSACIERLCQRGYLTRTPGRTRTIRFTELAQGKFGLGETP